MDGNGEDEVYDGYTSKKTLMHPSTSVKTAGISGLYRTTDAGLSWELIGDKSTLYDEKTFWSDENNTEDENDLEWENWKNWKNNINRVPRERSEWTVKKMLVQENENNNITIYLATSIGILRTTNALDQNVVWEEVFSIDSFSNDIIVTDNLIEGVDETDLEEKQLWGYKILYVPNSNILSGGLYVASITKCVKNPLIDSPIENQSIFYKSYLVYSETGNPGSWLEWEVPKPNQFVNSTYNSYRTDIAIPVKDGDLNYVYLFNKTTEETNNDFSVLKWNVLTKNSELIFEEKTSYHSYGGGLDNPYTSIAVSPDEKTILHALELSVLKLNFIEGINEWNTSETESVAASNRFNLHMDIEDIQFNSSSELYIATHGGMHKADNLTYHHFPPINVGLGVAEVKGFATSYSNPETISVGLWHDLTQATVNSEYSEQWSPVWEMFPEIGDAFDPDINYSDNSIIYSKVSNSAHKTYAHFDFPATIGYGLTQRPLNYGVNGSHTNAGTCLNYFNHNTLYTTWYEKIGDDIVSGWLFRHADKGADYYNTEWREIFRLRNGSYTHPIIEHYIEEYYTAPIEDLEVRISIAFPSKTNENLMFVAFESGGSNHLAITNKAQFGVNENMNTIGTDHSLITEINDSWIMVDNYTNLTNDAVPNLPNWILDKPSTPQYRKDQYFSFVKDVVSDPLNPNIFYVLSQGYYSNKILKYTYNGDILNDDFASFDPENLADFSVQSISYNINLDQNNSEIFLNSIYIMPGTRDIFIGTDMGVYHASLDDIQEYLDNDEQVANIVWKKYGDNLPHIDANEIEPNFIADKLRVATFGRGVWEIPLPCDKLDYAHVINTGEDVTINNYARFRQDVIVEDGATLTLTPQAKVYFAEHCALIVKPGGELIVDGALLSNACGDALWLGISVEGNANLSQTSANQGKVTVKNGATIENAHTGVWLRANTEECTEILNSGGGMVFASNSTFKNCYVGIEFSPYRDFFSNNNPKANRSRIRECHFLTTRTLNGGFEAKAGISLKEINKLYIRGNTFENTKVVGQNHPDYTGIGILSANSTFKAYDYCNVSLPYGTPCPEGDIVRNTFINLVHGVRAYAWDEINTFTVDNALFDKCAYGLFAKKVHYAKITKCDFDVSPDPTTVGTLQWTPYGAHLLGCGSYEVEENKFYSDDNSYERVGIVIENSSDISNEIYKNEFNKLFVGSLAQGDNQVDDNEDEGLEMLCGKYGEDDSNFYDIAFTDESHVAQVQGSNAIGNQYSPYNVMYVNSCTNDNNFHVDDDSQWFLYYYQGLNEYDFPNLTDCYNELLLIDVEIDNLGPYDEACPSSFSSSGDVIEKKEIVEVKRVEIIDVKSELSTLENGGEDEQLLVNSIKNSSNSSLTVRNLLYPLSPNLTDPVLIELIKRSPTMNEWHLTELLIGNSPLRLSVLEEYYMQNPLPAFLHNLLMNYQAGETNLAALKKELKSKKATKNRAEGDYIRRMFMDLEDAVDLEKIEQLLAQEEDNYSLKVKIALANAKGDFVGTQSFLDLYQPTSNTDAYLDFQTTLLEIIQQPNSFYELTGSQKNNLELIVNNNKDQGYAAENILEYSDDQVFDEWIVLPTAGNKSMRAKPNRELAEIPIMNAYPNPAVDEIYFTFSNQENLEQAILTIFDSEGRTMQQFDMVKYKGILRIPIKEWATGNYFSKLSINGLKISESKFTKL